MSQLYFEQEDLISRFGAEATLAQIFSEIENDLKTVQEVVCQFKVNGMALDEDGEKRVATSKVNEVMTLEVLSQQPTAILGDILVSWSDQIPAMLKQNDALADQIRFQGMEGQLKNLVDLIDQAQLLVESIMSIETVFADFPMVQSDQWRAAQKHMAEGIGEALQAFQKKDFNWLADILEYDMGHSLQTWMELLESLKQDVNSTAGAAP